MQQLLNNQFKWSFFPLERKTHNMHYIIEEEGEMKKFDYNFVLYLSRLCNDNIVTNDPYWQNKFPNIKYDANLDIHSLLSVRNSDTTLLLNFDLLIGDSINPVFTLDWTLKTRIFDLFNTGLMGEPENILHVVSYGKYRSTLAYYYNKMDQIFIDQTSTLRSFASTYYFWKNLSMHVILGEDIMYHMSSQDIDVKIETLNKKMLPELL